MDIEITIDLDEMLNGNYNFPDFENMMKETVRDGMKEFRKQARGELVSNIRIQGLGNSQLASTIVTRTMKDYVSLKVTAPYADFVEYGTGIIGMDNQHPNLPAGWEYLGGYRGVSSYNAQFDRGWYYPTTPDDPNPYKHEYNGQLYGYTMGLPSRPYMYDTWVWAKEYAPIIMEEVLHEKMLEVKRKSR